MALTDAYFSEEEYRAYAGKLEAAPAFLSEQAKAISRYLEAYHLGGLNFNNTGTAVARRIDPDYADRTLAVNPISSTVNLEIVVDGSRVGSFSGLTPLTSLQYQLAYNGDYEPTLRGYPYNQVIIPTWSSAEQWSPTSPVQITAIWGWPAVPDAVKLGAMELLRQLRLESPFATSTFNQEMGRLVGSNRNAREIVMSLARQYHPTGLVIA
jgi:hypothetical protein